MRAVPMCLGLLLLAGCGYTGDPMPPALHIPEKINDLGGLQRGSSIVVAFTPSLQSTDRMVLKEFKSIELRVGPIPEGEFQFDSWLRGSRAVEDVPMRAERTELLIPAAEFVGKPVLVAVRAIGPTGRPAEWSNYLTLRIVEPPAAPPGLRAASHPRGVQLQWDSNRAPEGATWRIYRLAPGEKEAAVAAIATGPQWIDPAAEEGKEYAYSVQLVVPTGAADAESELGPAVRLTPEDTFPPAVPAGLEAITGVNTVELTWERSPDSDTAGYILFRAAADGALERLAGPVDDPSYSDAKVESGKAYRYAVAAVDRKGNTSKPSEPISITAP